MAITHVNVGAQTASNSSPQAPVMAANHTTNDIILLIVGQASASGITFSPPANYNSLARNSNATRSMTLEVFAKVATSSSESDPSTTCSSSAGGWCSQIAVYRGVNTVTIEDNTEVTHDAAAAQTWQPNGITTQTAGAWVLSIVMSKDDNALNLSVANGYTTRMSGGSYDATAGNGSDYSIGLADQEFASTGAKTCPTWNQTINNNDAWVGITIALKPIVDTTCTPTTKALTLASFAPTVTTTNNQLVTPTTKALTLATFTPTVQTPVTVTITTKALTLSTFVPVIHLGVIPSTTALTLATFAPTVITPVVATPSTLALTMTAFEPTVLTPVVSTPTTKALTLTTYAPTVTGDPPEGDPPVDVALTGQQINGYIGICKPDWHLTGEQGELDNQSTVPLVGEAIVSAQGDIIRTYPPVELTGQESVAGLSAVGAMGGTYVGGTGGESGRQRKFRSQGTLVRQYVGPRR